MLAIVISALCAMYLCHVTFRTRANVIVTPAVFFCIPPPPPPANPRPDSHSFITPSRRDFCCFAIRILVHNKLRHIGVCYNYSNLTSFPFFKSFFFGGGGGLGGGGAWVCVEGGRGRGGYFISFAGNSGHLTLQNNHKSSATSL